MYYTNSQECILKKFEMLFLTAPHHEFSFLIRLDGLGRLQVFPVPCPCLLIHRSEWLTSLLTSHFPQETFLPACLDFFLLWPPARVVKAALKGMLPHWAWLILYEFVLFTQLDCIGVEAWFLHPQTHWAQCLLSTCRYSINTYLPTI